GPVATGQNRSHLNGAFLVHRFCTQRPHTGRGDPYSSPPKWDSILQGRGVTQSLPKRCGSPSADNSSRRGEQPQQATGQTTVNQMCTLQKTLIQISSMEILAVNIMSMMLRQIS
ncbi:hypothetical protein JOQ06_008940, partial [Pogonophryne albipinna]